MVSLEWVHVIIGGLSAIGGAGAGLIAGVWRVARIEGRLKLSFQTSIRECEQRFEDKVDQVTQSFDETLKGLRQKINDVELETERGFVAKGDFDDFRKEYREDMRDLKSSIAGITRSGR
jgi:hypothetical protein